MLNELKIVNMSKILSKLEILGLQNFCFCFVGKNYLRLISLFFQVNKWHISTPYHCRNYKRKVVDIINSLEPKVVVEIGCGVGDIINRIDSDIKFGFDNDKSVIKLATFLNKKTHFKEASFKGISKVDSLREIDALFAINWLHGLELPLINEMFSHLISTSKIKYIIVDQLLKINNNQNIHNYDQIFASNFKKLKIENDDGDNVRNILVFKNKFLK